MNKTELVNLVNDMNVVKKERLNYCKAYILTGYINGFKVHVLQSYNTKVAAFFYINETLYIFDEYSRTTSSHVAKFVSYLLDL